MSCSDRVVGRVCLPWKERGLPSWCLSQCLRILFRHLFIWRRHSRAGATLHPDDQPLLERCPERWSILEIFPRYVWNYI